MPAFVCAGSGSGYGSAAHNLEMLLPLLLLYGLCVSVTECMLMGKDYAYMR